ncbi:DUF2264 domain-containing protein [Jejubacter calystegiae]|nr:DUF2264 domain-containing protein [Jejubacter calystegiae]
MHPENMNSAGLTLNNREEVSCLARSLLAAAEPWLDSNRARLDLGNSCAHYGHDIGGIEAFSRLLWGMAPLLAGGETPARLMDYIATIKAGVTPGHSGYWGDIGPFDQRVVEMAAFGLLLAIAPQPLLAHFSEVERQRLWRWLKQSEQAEIPDNNWHFFPILVQVGFRAAGLPFDMTVVERHFASMEAYWLGEGWYSDGPGRPRDYYIAMGFHFYGLLYARLMADIDPERCALLRQRATRFARDFIHFFDEEGAAIPFGRSLTYRFAQGAFWSACAFTGLEPFAPGVIKGLVLRHLRWWMRQPIFDRDGVLSVGYCYPNLVMAEDYNAPGSPYWALKTLLVLALEESHPFWQAPELPLPPLAAQHSIPQADQVLVRQGRHLWMATAGQLELNNYVNTEAKYCKFAYSSRFGFTLERGRFGLPHAAVDSMMLLSEGDAYWRGRRDCERVETWDGIIYSRWRPWPEVQIDSWQLALGEWQVRVHHLFSDRPLESAEGGFSLPGQQVNTRVEPGACWLHSGESRSGILDIGTPARCGEVVMTPPNSNLMWPERCAIPVLRGELSAGEHLLCCAVWAGDSDVTGQEPPRLQREGQQIVICHGERQTAFRLVATGRTL